MGTEASPPVADRRRPDGRGIAAIILVVVASIAILASTLAIWTARTVFNRDVFVRRVTSVTDDPRVTQAMSEYITTQVMQAIDAPALVQKVLPQAAAPAVGPIVAAIRSRVSDRVDEILQSEAFQDRFATLLGRAHDAAIDLLEGERVAGLQVEGDSVVLNLVPIVAEVLRALGADGLVERIEQLPAFGGDQPPPEQVQQLATALGVTLPPDFGQITVFSTEAVSEASDALELFRRLVILIVIVTVLVIALALVVSRRRWRTLAQLGVGAAAAFVVGAAVISWVQGRIVDAAAAGDGREAARAVADNFVGALRTTVVVLLIVSLLVALAGFLLGDSATAKGLRTRAGGGVGFVRDHADGLRVAAIALGVLLLLWIGLSWFGVLVAVVLTGLALVGISVAQRGQPASVG